MASELGAEEGNALPRSSDRGWKAKKIRGDLSPMIGLKPSGFPRLPIHELAPPAHQPEAEKLTASQKFRSNCLGKTMDPIGKSPISVPILFLGKLTGAACCLFFLVKTLGIDTMLYDGILTRSIGIVLIVAGFVLFILGFIYLGRSASVGLPGEKTELKTHGVYRISRNPMYVGGFLICAGSCLLFMHLMNFLLCATYVVIHHVIVTVEEQFLEKRFGERWLEHKQRVLRYLGWPDATAANRITA
jgi:protein-S-isoprenylcysteine O-methyltransferase Ste14